MQYINQEFNYTILESLAKKFKEQGFVKLINVFDNDFIKYIENKIEASINAPIDRYQTGFNRIAFDLFVADKIVDSLMQNSKFRNIMFRITKKELFYTQGLGFELEKNKSTGFPWHIGTQSFGYQQASDFGCTIWMPLDEINTKKQRGGMAYIPENIISGKFMYEDIDPSIVRYIKERYQNNDNPQLEDYLQLRDGILNNPYMKVLLDHFAVEDDFAIGDILLFNKNVIHRSIKLEEGALQRRRAFAMRFIENHSTYDQERALNLEFPRQLFNYPGCSTFHLDVCGQDGEIIAKSRYFSNHDNRHLFISK
ncbi:MAG: hypothetical protein QNJ42_11315 [Crocosphaera sp.]|nr:hypothetical protein [Crocosphaera sp.]